MHWYYCLDFDLILCILLLLSVLYCIPLMSMLRSPRVYQHLYLRPSLAFLPDKPPLTLLISKDYIVPDICCSAPHLNFLPSMCWLFERGWVRDIRETSNECVCMDNSMNYECSCPEGQNIPQIMFSTIWHFAHPTGGFLWLRWHSMCPLWVVHNKNCRGPPVTFLEICFCCSDRVYLRHVVFIFFIL